MSNDDQISVDVVAIDSFTSQLNAATTAIKDFTDRTNSGMSGIKDRTHEAKDAFKEMATEGVQELAKLGLEVFALGEMFKTLKEGLHFADSIRDTEASLQVLARTSEGGVAAFEKLKAAADGTRSTTLELANAFREALPAAIRRGVSDETLANITVQLAKIAPLMGRSLESVMTEFEGIMAGRVRKTSPLANLLLGGSGYTIEDLTTGGKAGEVFAAMFQNMDKFAAKGDELGQSLASAGEKIKDKFFEAFADGFNKTGASAGDAYKAMLDAFTDPRVLNGITAIGETAKTLLPIFGKLATLAAQISAGIPSAIGESIGGAPSKYGGPAGFEQELNQDYGIPISAINKARGALQSRGLAFDPSDRALHDYLEKTMHSLDDLDTHVAGSKDKLNEFGKAAEENGKKLLEMSNFMAKAGDELTRAFRAPSDSALDNALQANFDKAKGLKDQWEGVAKTWEASGVPGAQEMANALRALEKTVDDAAGKQREALMDNAVEKFWQDGRKALTEYTEKLDQLQSRSVDQINALPFAPGGSAEGLNNIFNNAQQALQGQAAQGTLGPAVAKEIQDGATEAARIWIKGVTQSSELIGRRFDQIGKDFQKNTVDSLSSGLSGLFGGQGLSGFGFGDMKGTISDAITQGFAGLYGVSTNDQGQVVDKNGKVYGSVQQAIGAQRGSGAPFLGGTQADTANTVGVGVDLAQVGLAAYGNRGTSDLSTVVQASLQGLTVGGWLGAIVFAVVAEVGKLAQPSVGDSYRYGVPGVIGGEATFRVGQNIDKNAAAGITADIQGKFDQEFGGLQRVLFDLKAPLVDLANFTVKPVIGRFESGADLGNAASGGFDKELQEWINNGMPRQIAEKFFKPLAGAFEKYGFSEGTFKTYFDALEKLDPKNALDLFSALADGAVKVQAALEFFRKPTGFGGPTYGENFTSTASQLGTALAEGSKTFPDQLKDSGDQLIRLANSMKDLPLSDQIHAFQQLGQGLSDMKDKTVQFLQQIQATIESFQKSIDKQKTGYELADLVDKNGQPDIQAQIDFLKNRATGIFNQIGQTSDPTKVAQLGSDLQALIDQIVQLGGQAGPEAAAAFRHWGETSLDAVNKAVTERLQALGNEVGDITTHIADQLQPALDLFTHGLDTTVDPINNFRDNLRGAGDDLDYFRGRVRLAADGGTRTGTSAHTVTTQSRRLLATG